MMSQTTKEYLENMYERDMNNEEKIINCLNNIYDKLDEILEFESDVLTTYTFGMKSDARKSDDEIKKDYPSGISKDEHLHIQQEGLRGAVDELLKATRAGNQNGVNEAIYCALVRLIQIVDNLGKRVFNA